MTASHQTVGPGFRSIFTPCTRRERDANFEAYRAYSLGHDGDILEDQKDLTSKRERLARVQADPVRSRRPLADPEAFYRNYVTMRDDPRVLDRKTQLLTFLYKFARHEYVGISAAWDFQERTTGPRALVEKIGRYHLRRVLPHAPLPGDPPDVPSRPNGVGAPRKMDEPCVPDLPPVPRPHDGASRLRERADGLDRVPACRRGFRRHSRRRASGPGPRSRAPAGDHDRRARPRGSAPQLHGYDGGAHGPSDGSRDVPGLLP